MAEDYSERNRILALLKKQLRGVEKQVPEYKRQQEYVSSMMDTLTEGDLGSMDWKKWAPTAERMLANIWTKNSLSRKARNTRNSWPKQR
jgi:hypothetical protein